MEYFWQVQVKRVTNLGEYVGRMSASGAATTRRHATALRDCKVHVFVVVDRREDPVRPQHCICRIASTRWVLGVGCRGDGRVWTIIPVGVVTRSTAAELERQTNTPGIGLNGIPLSTDWTASQIENPVPHLKNKVPTPQIKNQGPH